MSLKFAVFEIKAKSDEWRESEESKELKGEHVSLILSSASDMEIFHDNIAYERLFGIPMVKGMGYQKSLTECLANAFQALSNAMTKNLKNFEGEVTEDNLPIDLRNQVAQIGNTLQWIVNSASWREGTYYPFDAMDIEQQLRYSLNYSSRPLKKEESKQGQFPSFESVDTELIRDREESIATRDSLADLIDYAVKELPYEPRFFYTYNGKFSLYRKNQLR